jgi:hypothetical protein
VRRLVRGGGRVKIIAWAIGLFLLGAAGLKLYGLNDALHPPVSDRVSPAVRGLGLAWEIILGSWLITGRTRFAPWLAAVVTFVAFSLISLYLGARGEPDCGCLGAVRVNPWVTLSLDLVALGLLFVGRPARPRAWRVELAGSRWAFAAVLAVSVLAATGWAMYGSIEAAVARFRGDPVALLGPDIDLGAGKPGDRLTGTAVLVNLSDRPARVIGYRSECGCLTTQDLPLTIPPGERAEVRLVLTVPDLGPGRIRRQANFHIEGNPPRNVRVRVAADVRP